jgi:hypothetical protein
MANMTALMLLPTIPECATPPQGFYRKEWSLGGRHYCFVFCLAGSLKLIARVLPTDGLSIVQLPVAGRYELFYKIPDNSLRHLLIGSTYGGAR